MLKPSNAEMLRAIQEKVAVDISSCERTSEGWYRLTDKKLVDFDLCDITTGRWIKTVGQNSKTGEFFAATQEHAFERPKSGWICVWIR